MCICLNSVKLLLYCSHSLLHSFLSSLNRSHFHFFASSFNYFHISLLSAILFRTKPVLFLISLYLIYACLCFFSAGCYCNKIWFLQSFICLTACPANSNFNIDTLSQISFTSVFILVCCYSGISGAFFFPLPFDFWL